MNRPRWKARQVEAVRRNATTKDATAGACVWCPQSSPKPTQRAEGKGLSRTMCRAHYDHRSRHGHPVKPSYGGTTLRPLEKMARRWLNKHRKELVVAAALIKTRNVILRGYDAGQTFPTKPKEKARAVFGRLYSRYCGDQLEGIRTRWPKQRAVETLALQAAAVTLSVRLAACLDSGAVSDSHFLNTQIGKVIFRRAGGWLRRAERVDRTKTEYRTQPDGTLRRGPAIYAVELNRYAISRGPALAMIGRQLHDATETLWATYAATLEAKARKLKRPVVKPSAKGGKVIRKAQSQNPLGRPHDKERKLTRPL